MIHIKKYKRLLQIYSIVINNGLDQLLTGLGWFKWLKIINLFYPKAWFRKNQLPRGVVLRRTLEDLGPIFVKFGQALSTRPDLLPADINCELSKLQDQVPPCSLEHILSAIESSFGKPADELFASFDLQPLASASIAQVHAAILHDGKSVVVKVLRPNIRKLLEQDLKILYTGAAFIERYFVDGQRLKPIQVIQEFEYSLFNELNLQQEAGNAAQLKRNFHNSPILYVPEIHWNYVSMQVLVMERIYGIPVTDIAKLNAYNINLKKLAERGLEIFFLQVFRDSFFHADMHPGNIFVSMENPLNPQYICIDFGIIGTLNEVDKRYLAENLLAFFNRDYRRVAELHIESGWVARDTRVEEFESAIRTVCEPIFEKPLKDLSFAALVMQLFEVARRFNMEVQPQLVLLQKTLLAVEGLGRQIYPELDLWKTAKPFFEKFVKEQVGPKALLRNIKENLPFMMEHLPSMPKLINDVLLLSKEQKRISIEQALAPSNKKKNHDTWWGGFGFGVFIIMACFSSIVYFTPIDRIQFAGIGAIIGAIGGLLSIYKKR